MARRVQQADGSYCYTDNCRIHDRSVYDSSGLQAVLGDARVARQDKFAEDTAAVLRDKLGFDGESAQKLAEKVSHDTFNTTGQVTAYSLSKELEKAAEAEGVDLSKLSSGDFIEACYNMHNSLLMDGVIRQGDEVVINETGERGTISEGDSMFGGMVRFNPENKFSRNSFAWFQREDVTKVIASEKSLTRQQIMAAPVGSLIPGSMVKQLIDEETSPHTRNAQAAREFGKHGKVAREALRKFGEDYAASHKNGVLRPHLVQALKDEYFSEPDAGMTPEQVKATKSGLRNLITYFDSTK